VGSWTAYTILGKQALKGLTPIAATTYASLWGLALLSIGAAMEYTQLDITHLNWQVLSATAFLGIFGTVIGFVWYYEGVKAIGPARTAVFNNLVPVFGIALSTLILNEPILISMVIGGLLVIAGVSLTNRAATSGATIKS
jgi:drug/metabolite transporter (DMT)-like permease